MKVYIKNDSWGWANGAPEWQIFLIFLRKWTWKDVEQGLSYKKFDVIYYRINQWNKAKQQLFSSLQLLLQTALLLPELATFVELAALLLFKTTRNQYYTACGWS